MTESQVSWISCILVSHNNTTCLAEDRTESWGIWQPSECPEMLHWSLSEPPPSYWTPFSLSDCCIVVVLLSVKQDTHRTLSGAEWSLTPVLLVSWFGHGLLQFKFNWNQCSVDLSSLEGIMCTEMWCIQLKKTQEHKPFDWHFSHEAWSSLFLLLHVS